MEIQIWDTSAEGTEHRVCLRTCPPASGSGLICACPALPPRSPWDLRPGQRSGGAGRLSRFVPVCANLRLWPCGFQSSDHSRVCAICENTPIFKVYIYIMTLKKSILSFIFNNKMYTFCVYSSDKCILPNASNFKLN